MPIRPNIDINEPIRFEGLQRAGSGNGACDGGKCYYELVGWRAPKKGEWYLSGALVEAYRASNDFTTAFFVVRPTHRVKLVSRYERGEAI